MQDVNTHTTQNIICLLISFIVHLQMSCVLPVVRDFICWFCVPYSVSHSCILTWTCYQHTVDFCLTDILILFLFCFPVSTTQLTCIYTLFYFQLSTVWMSISGSCVESGPPCSSLVHLFSLLLLLLCWCLASLLCRHFILRFWNHTFT